MKLISCYHLHNSSWEPQDITLTVSRSHITLTVSRCFRNVLSTVLRGSCLCFHDHVLQGTHGVCVACVCHPWCVCVLLLLCVCHGVCVTVSLVCVSSVYIFVCHSVTVCVWRRGCVMHIPTYSPPCAYILLFNNFKSQVVTGVSVVDNPLRGCLPFHG